MAQETGWTYEEIGNMPRSHFWSYIDQRTKLNGGRSARKAGF